MSTSITQVTMLRNSCAGAGCTRECLKPRIIQHIEDEGYLPALLSPCSCNSDSPYWVWINRYYGDLVLDLNAPDYPHTTTIWQVSGLSNYNTISDTHRYSAPCSQYISRCCHPDCRVAGLRMRPRQHGACSAFVVLSGPG